VSEKQQKIMQQTSADEYKASFYPESTFGGFTDIDGTVVFYARVNALVQPSFVAVDFGCGRGRHAEDSIIFRRNLRCLKGKVSKVIGIDIDSVGTKNPTVDEFRELSPDRPWPVDDKSCHLILCDSVIEHLSDPHLFFRQAKRVLVQGGYLCVRTPNVFSYVGITSKLLPSNYHKKVLSKAQPNRKEEDVFPALYRCNTISALRGEMLMHGFHTVVYGYEAEPSYLNFSTLAYGVGVLHQRFAPGFARPTIFGFGQLL
jgi:SAM-dependent methyltransferase